MTRGYPDPNPGLTIKPNPEPLGRWIFNPAALPDPHQCPLPQEWTLGTLWQCPEGHLWTVTRRYVSERAGKGYPPRLEWWPASWWQRRRFGPGMKRARLDMADLGARVQNAPKPHPPQGPSGVSRATPPSPPLPYNPGGPV